MRHAFVFPILCILLFTFLFVCPQTPPDQVNKLPGIDTLTTRTLSGLLLANQTYGAYLYYLFMESKNDPKNDPVVLWLQGGPGSTSMFGAFCEFGPYLIGGDGTFSNNIYTWNAKANILWIDQPVGTGYSYVTDPKGYAKDEVSLSKDLYTALLHFMQLHPEYSKQRFYIFGESYAGKYIPWLASTIIQDTPRKINLYGSGIGDGWVDPRLQAASYAPFLFLNGRVTEAQVAQANKSYAQYIQLLDAQRWKQAGAADDNMLSMLEQEASPPVTDEFDIRYESDITDPSYEAMMKYMRRPDVMAALYTTGRTFSGGGKAYRKLTKDEEQSALFQLPVMLRSTSVLLYNGQYDLICNWLGTAYYSASIPGWQGQSSFNSANNTNWLVDGAIAGYYKYAANLAQLVVYNAGHMSPFDQPKNTQAMLYRFIDGGFV